VTLTFLESTAQQPEPYEDLVNEEVLEKNGGLVLSVWDIVQSHTSVFADIAYACMMKGFDQAWGGPDQWRPLGEFLVNAHRIILFVDWQRIIGWDAKDLALPVRAGARMILVKEGSLPEESEAFRGQMPLSLRSHSKKLSRPNLELYRSLFQFVGHACASEAGQKSLFFIKIMRENPTIELLCSINIASLIHLLHFLRTSDKEVFI